MKDEHKEGTIRTSTPTDFRNGAARTGDTEDLFLYLIICLFTAGIIMSALWVKLAITEKTEMAERNKKMKNRRSKILLTLCIAILCTAGCSSGAEKKIPQKK